MMAKRAKTKRPHTRRKDTDLLAFLRDPHWERPQWPLDHPDFRLLLPRRFFQWAPKSLYIELEMIYWYRGPQVLFQEHPAIQVIDDWLSGMFYAAESVSPKRAKYYGGGVSLVWNGVPDILADLTARFVIRQVEGALNDFWERWSEIEPRWHKLDGYDPQWNPDPYAYAKYLQSLKTEEVLSCR